MATPAATLGFREVLAIPPIRRLWLAQLISVFGDFLAIFGVFSVATFRLHATAAEISLILVAFLLPLGVVSPLAGVMVDRWNVKRTMIASDLIRALLVVFLIFATDIRHIYAIFFALSTVSSFFIPAQTVTLRTLCPPEGLMAANALMSQAIQVTQIVSPAIAGVLVATAGPNFCYYFDAASFLFSAFMVSAIAIHCVPQAGAQNLRALLADLTTGLKFIFTHSAISFVMISMTVGMFAIRCFGALLAVYVRDVLSAGSATFGILNSLIGVGMIMGTQVVHHFAAKRSKNHLVVFGLLLSGLFIMLPAASATITATVIGMLGLGFGVAFIFIPAQTMLQQVTPAAMLGRVSSSLWSALALTQVAALTLSGSTAQAIGIRNLYFASAAMLVLIAAAGWRKLASQEVSPVK
jgi:DHA3 family macrolide efflux protein-like MFS transporter